MDFGVVGFDGLVGSDITTHFGSLASDPVTKQKWYGSSGFLKQERSSYTEDDWRSSKVDKTDDFSASETTLLQQRNNTLLRSNNTYFHGQQQQQMLSFASPKSDVLSADRTSENATLPYYNLTSPAYNRNTGYRCGSLNVASMHLGLAGARGPFTPSQWMELEHQALIYKYITANVPIPSNLLIPIRKAFESFRCSSFPGGLPRPNTLGWGTFHLGFSNNTDPEPGRCRRTDGKKWRCSRDAVADQKYCERHMNRGRHRSRKPVEGQSGHSVSAATTSTTSKLIPITSSTGMGPTGSGCASSGLAVEHQQQLKNLQPSCASNLSASTARINRMFLDKVGVDDGKQDTSGLSMLPPTIDFKFKGNSLLLSKQKIQFEESSRSELGLVCSDSLLKPSHRSTSLWTCRNYGSSQDLTEQETESEHSVRQFFDEWPKNQPNRTSISWPEIDMQSDRTQLSISIPVTSSDLMSSSSSPNNDKLTLSPIQMGLGVGSVLDEPSQRQTTNYWIPISWETSMGGPLGEVLHNTNNNYSPAGCKNTSMLNLTSEDWDNSPRQSPTGVLQKTAFGSLANNSAGSSPRAETSKAREGASSCNDHHA